MKHQQLANETAAAWQDRYMVANSLGAEDFGTLWLAVNEKAVASFRQSGLGDEIESNYRLRAAIATSLYRTLRSAINQPNNMKRAAERIAARKDA